MSVNPQAKADSGDTSVINNGPDQEGNYNKSFTATKKVSVKDEYFYSKPGAGKKLGTTNKLYDKDLAITRISSQDGDVYFKTKYGWVSADAFLQTIKYTADMDYKMKVTDNDVAVYNKPANTDGAKKIGTTDALGLSGNWYDVDKRSDTNLKKGYYRFTTDDGNTYWIAGKDMSFNLSSLKGSNAKVEKAISVGEKLIGKSKYDDYGGGRTAASIAARKFDCSSFVHYVYGQAGVNLGPTATATTYSMKYYGKAVSPSNMKRGDIFFFNAKGQGAFCHMAIYLGDGLFLHDSPSADTGGVGVSSLKDKYWSTKFNGWVRRVAQN